MKTEELLELGLDKEQAGRILAMNGKDIERTKSAAEAQRLELAQLKQDMEQCTAKLEEYRSLDLEGLQSELAAWKEKAAETERAAKEEATREKIRLEADKLYRESGAKSAAVLDAMIRWDEVKCDQDAVTGIREQIGTMQAEYGFLFEEAKPMPCFSAEIREEQDEDSERAVRAAMGL